MELLLGARIRRERIRLGCDQAELALRMGVGQQTVSGWERGASRPRRAMIGQLADIFEIEVDVLLQEAGYVAATADTPGEVARPVRPLLTLLPLQALAGAEIVVRPGHGGFDLHGGISLRSILPGRDRSLPATG